MLLGAEMNPKLKVTVKNEPVCKVSRHIQVVLKNSLQGLFPGRLVLLQSRLI